MCKQIHEITEQIRAIEPYLRQNGTKAGVVIFTDGEASDGDLAAALRPLKDLPVMMTVRLCTDEENISTYWDRIESSLELQLDILDDLAGEAAEIRKINGWLTYGEPLHRLREFCCPVKELDRIDEAKLNADQMRVILNVT